MDALKNFAYSTVATAPSPAASGTSLVVAAGDGAKFPTPPFNATIWPVGVIPLVTNAEIVRVTALATDTLTITRAQESSNARSVIIGDQIAQTITKKVLDDLSDITYLGDYAAGNYNDGDIVVLNGVVYLCVRPTSAVPTPWAPLSGGVAYGTSLPNSPYDGQEAVLVDSVTNPTYQWKFRYNAGHTSDAYKWEFIGGAPASRGPSGLVSGIFGTNWFDLSSGPTFTAPRAGVYILKWGLMMHWTGGTFSLYTLLARALWAAQSSTNLQFVVTAGWGGGNVAGMQSFTVAAGDALKLQGRQDAGANQSDLQDGWIEIIPLKVS